MIRTTFSRLHKLARQEAGFESAPVCVDTPTPHYVVSIEPATSQTEASVSGSPRRSRGLLAGAVLSFAALSGSMPAAAEVHTDVPEAALNIESKAGTSDHYCIGYESDLSRVYTIDYDGGASADILYCYGPATSFPLNKVLYDTLDCGKNDGRPKLADQIRDLGPDPRLTRIVRDCPLRWWNVNSLATNTTWFSIAGMPTPGGEPFNTIRMSKAQRKKMIDYIDHRRQYQCNPDKPMTWYDWCAYEGL